MRRFAPILLLATALSGCDGDPAPAPTEDARPLIVASIHPVAALIHELVGDAADVRTLLPPGAHADTYEPTPRMAGAVEGAALVVRVGAGLDDWVAAPAGARVLTLTDGLPLDDGNPHVWLDPILVRDHLLPRLADALADALAGALADGDTAMVAADPAPAAAIRARAAAFADSLTALDEAIRRRLDDAPTRRFVAAHPAWPYFARRYGLTQVGVLQPSPGEEIGTRELARMVTEARDGGVRAVIAEPQLGRAGVSALADELNVRVEVGDPIGGEDAEGRETYPALMRWNAQSFARALGGGG